MEEDDEENKCDVAEVFIAVNSVNDPPVAAADSGTTDEDTPISLAVLENDSDPEGEDLTVSDSLASEPTNGNATVNSDGTITYTPNADFHGSDMLTYQVCDPEGLCASADVTIFVNSVNDGPVALDDAGETPEDTPISIPVLENDSDVDGEDLVVTSVSHPSNGGATINSDGIDYLHSRQRLLWNRHLHLPGLRSPFRLRIRGC